MFMSEIGRPKGIQTGSGKWGRPTYNQAAKIIAKFGGPYVLAKGLGKSFVTIYRWTYAHPYGTDGLIPSSALADIQKLARLEGILLTPEDWMAERIAYPELDS